MIGCHLFFWSITHLMPYWGIFCFGWDLQIFMDSHAYLHLRGAHQDEDLFVILSWSLGGLFLKPPSQARIFQHLNVVILLIRDTSLLMRESDSIVDLDNEDQIFDDGWFHVIQFPTYHISDAILGHISVLVEICRFSWSCMLISTYEICAEMMTYLLSYPDPLVEPLWSHLVKLVFFGVWLSSCFSFWVMDLDDEGRAPDDRWLEAIWFFWPITHLIPYWGIFSIRLRFVDLHWLSWPSPVTRCTLGWWFDFIFPWSSGGAFLESFGRAYIFLCCHDSWM